MARQYINQSWPLIIFDGTANVKTNFFNSIPDWYGVLKLLSYILPANNESCCRIKIKLVVS